MAVRPTSSRQFDKNNNNTNYNSEKQKVVEFNIKEESSDKSSDLLNKVKTENKKEEKYLKRELAYRSIILFSSLFSISALLCLCALLPSLYSHVNSLAGFARKDFAFCEVILLNIKNPSTF